MSRKQIYINNAGIVSALGSGCTQTAAALLENRRGLAPLTLFSLLSGKPLPVAQVDSIPLDSRLPRTHQLAMEAALQAVDPAEVSIDAMVIGTTTGGIATTENLLRSGETNPDLYRYHGLGTVAEQLAAHFCCSGPVLTVSTACSSGAVAISIAMELLRSGQATRVLAGGADSLCRLTYFGFNSLQLVDPDGARPMDTGRKGMSVGEGAAMVLLSTQKQNSTMAEVAGYGLSCDAYHPATPHPEGKGARQAMAAAMTDANIHCTQIDYINLHGTGTPDNDRAESKAIKALFSTPPPVSSIKGATGHTLAAAGAIEAVVAGLAVSREILPANQGCSIPDPELIPPQKIPERHPLKVVLSNSFGFGGNNGSLLITTPRDLQQTNTALSRPQLQVLGAACLTGAGDLNTTMAALQLQQPVAGLPENSEFSANLPARKIRRLKRLARMGLALATAARENSGTKETPHDIFMGTGWGALSETHDFLKRLEETDEQFPSPTDFIGSVHNAPAGQIALFSGSTGANITCSGGNYSFEQALLSAELLAGDAPCCVLGADEYHASFTPLFDPSFSPHTPPADGGGALYMEQATAATRQYPCLQTSFYAQAIENSTVTALVEKLGGTAAIHQRFGLVLAGIPAADQPLATAQLRYFSKRVDLNIQVVDYRKYVGQFASASSVAAVLATAILLNRKIPAAFAGENNTQLKRPGILILGLGRTITAMECYLP